MALPQNACMPLDRVIVPVDWSASVPLPLVQVNELSNQFEEVKHELPQLKKAHIGLRSERSKMPRVPSKPVTAEERLAKRRVQAAERAQTETVRTEHKVPDEERACPSCGNDKLQPIGPGGRPSSIEFVPARFVRHEHVQEVLRCRCGDYVVTAPGAPEASRRGVTARACSHTWRSQSVRITCRSIASRRTLRVAASRSPDRR